MVSSTTASKAASDGTGSACSTAAICLRLHPFLPVMRYAHSHVGLSPANETRHHAPSLPLEATSHRFPLRALIWSPC